MELNLKQYILLRKIKNSVNFSATGLSHKDESALNYLLELDYIESAESDVEVGKTSHYDGFTAFGGIKIYATAYQITEKGKSALYSFFDHHIGRYVPIVISIVALIISVIALCK